MLQCWNNGLAWKTWNEHFSLSILFPKEAARPIAETSVWRGVTSWKLPICLMIFEKGFVENRYLFGSQQSHMETGKLVSVRWTDKASWKTLEKGAPGRNIFENFEHPFLNSKEIRDSNKKNKPTTNPSGVYPRPIG